VAVQHGQRWALGTEHVRPGEYRHDPLGCIASVHGRAGLAARRRADRPGRLVYAPRPRRALRGSYADAQ